jgi:nitrite reductase/ring-hydroxylating ferredoxin subunit
VTAVQPPRFVMRKYVGPRADEVGVGERFIGNFGGKDIGILNVDGEYYAFLHKCPHLGGPLCEGTVLGLVHSSGPGDIKFDGDRKMLTCPWHGWEFDLKTGQSYWNPTGLRARMMRVHVENGAQVAAEIESGTAVQLVKGPYVAETFKVTIESAYLVVTVREPAPPAPEAGAGTDTTSTPAVTAATAKENA